MPIKLKLLASPTEKWGKPLKITLRLNPLSFIHDAKNKLKQQGDISLSLFDLMQYLSTTDNRINLHKSEPGFVYNFEFNNTYIKATFSFHTDAPLTSVYKFDVPGHFEICLTAKPAAEKLAPKIKTKPIGLILVSREGTHVELSMLQKAKGVSGSTVRALVYYLLHTLGVTSFAINDDANIQLEKDLKWPVNLSKKIKTGVGFYPNAAVTTSARPLKNGGGVRQNNNEFTKALKTIATLTNIVLTKRMTPTGKATYNKVCQTHLGEVKGRLFIELIDVLEVKLKLQPPQQTVINDAKFIITNILQGNGFNENAKDPSISKAFYVLHAYKYFDIILDPKQTMPTTAAEGKKTGRLRATREKAAQHKPTLSRYEGVPLRKSGKRKLTRNPQQPTKLAKTEPHEETDSDTSLETATTDLQLRIHQTKTSAPYSDKTNASPALNALT